MHNKPTTTCLLLCLTLLIFVVNSTCKLEQPSDVTLANYNTTEFSILLGNITSNLTQIQTEIVMTSSSLFLPSVLIPIRASIALIFDSFLFICIFALRDYEPLKSKLFISIVLTAINVICHIPASLDMIPFIRVYFQSYWNKFIFERSVNPSLDAQTFYMNNLDSNGLPTWLSAYITFENVYCFVGQYLIYGLIIGSVSLYAIQVAKFILLNIIRNMRQTIVKAMEEFKKKQFENMKIVRESNKNATTSTMVLSRSKSSSSIFRSSQSLKGSVLNLDLKSLETSSTSSDSNITQVATPLSARSSKKENDMTIATTIEEYEDIALDLTSDDAISNSDLDKISNKGKLVNFLKRVIKYRIIEIGFVSLCMAIWYIIISVQIAVHNPDKWSSLFYNWDSYSGYCRKEDRDAIFFLDAGLSIAIFLVIPVLLVTDFFISIYHYKNHRLNNTERGEKTSNFLVYVYYESDPFVYRIESTWVLSISGISLTIYIVLSPYFGNTVINLIGNLCILLGLNFLGGSAGNPGITIIRTMWNYYLVSKSKSKKPLTSNDQPAFQNLQELISSPVNSSTIDYVILHKKERELFYQYLKNEYSIENLLFYEDLHMLRNINPNHLRSKIAKIKEMVQLYLSEGDSVFEVNIPSKVIHSELKEYRALINLLNQENIKVNQLPKRIVRDSQTRYLPNIDLSKEEAMKPLIEHLCQPTIFSSLSFDIYKNLMDSYYRFNNSRKWKEYVKSVVTPEP